MIIYFGNKFGDGIIKLCHRREYISEVKVKDDGVKKIKTCIGILFRLLFCIIFLIFKSLESLVLLI